MQNVLVTGGAGFVGSNLALGLAEHKPGVRVVALDNLKRRGAELNVPRLQAAGIEFIHGDIRNPEDFEGVGEVDLILECSAEPSVLAGYDSSPAYLLNTNLGGTINCLEVARKHSAGMIFLSTSRVYPVETIRQLKYTEGETRFVMSDGQNVPGASKEGISEAFPLEGPRSLYGATKLCSELILHEYIDMYGLQGVINRCGVLTGPWQMGKVDQGVVALWIARHLFGGKLSYIGYGGTGKQVRDMLHIDDLLPLVLYQIDHLGELSGETFNVGGGVEVSASLLELTEHCREVTGNSIEIGAVPETRNADIPLYITDCGRVKARTGWKPERDVHTIVTDICAWMREHETALKGILGG